MKRLKVGYMSVSKASWVTPAIDGVRTGALASLGRLPYEIVHGDALTTTVAEAAALCSEMRRREIDALVLHMATFPVGAILPAVARALDVPVLLYATPESPGEGGMWAQNSFCGANMAAHTLRKMGRKYVFLFGPTDTLDALAGEHLAVVDCMRGLASAKVGLVGGCAPGFYTSNCDELRLRSRIGAEVEIIDLLEIVDAAGRLDAGEAREGEAEVRRNAASFCPTIENDLAPAGRLYQSLRNTAAKYGLSAYAIRCWPEWSDIFGIAPCAAMGMLNNIGLVTSCEGDVLGAVLMQAQAALGGGIPFFADMISFDNARGTAVFWHCGAAPSALCRRFEETRMRQHFRVDGGDRKGLVNEFSLKPGRVTVAQLDEDGDGYRMLIVPGTALDTAPSVRGNPLEIRLDPPVEKVVECVMRGGFKHHYSLIHADIADRLARLCEWLDITPVIPR